jgi:cytochrome P450
MTHPPGPRGLQALGFLGNGSMGGTVEFLERTAREYGSFSSFRILHKRIYLLDDAPLIGEILVARQHEFMRDSGATLLRELVGDGLLTREEPQHRERRRVLQPAFHKEQIASYASVMVSEADRIADEWKDTSTIDIRQQMRRLTLSIVGATLFGAEFRDEATQIANILDRVIRKSARIAPAFALLEPAALFYRRLFPSSRSVLFHRERQELEEVIAPILARRRDGNERDILSLLMSSPAEMNAGLSDTDLKNEAITFVLAGHETTSTALTWTWKLLAEHPAVAEKFYAEVDAVLGNRLPRLEDLPALTYTANVFKEAMRLYPPALLFARRPKNRLMFGGYQIERGESIFLSPFITQRNPRYFDAPEAFQPDRWNRPEPARFAYFPFGAGAKVCIGEPFARLEGVLALAVIGRKWQLLRDGQPPLEIRGGALPSAAQPVMMRTAARSRETVSA